MLTSLASATYKLHAFLFGYLPQLPVAWNSDETKLVISKSYLQWGVAILFHSDAFLIMAANAYVVTTHFAYQRRPFFEMTHAFIFITGAFMVMAHLLVILMFLHQLRDSINGFNHIVTLEYKMMKAIRPQAFNKAGKFTNEGRPDLGWGAMYLMIFCLGTAPYWLIPAVIFMHWDPFFFLLRDILPPAEYWGWLEIMGSTVARYILAAPSVIEIFRTMGHMLLEGHTLSTATFNIMKFLKNDMKSVEEFIHYYNLYTLSFRVTEILIGNVLFACITLGFWGTSISLWFCVVGFELINPVMYACLATGVFIALVITAATMTLLKLSLEMGDGAIREHVIMSEAKFSRVKTREAKIAMKRVACLDPVKFGFGPFFKIGKNIDMAYFSNLIERVSDMVLMFDLKRHL